MAHKEHVTTRIEMMQKWETEMKAFHEHDGRAVWIKSKVDWLKHNLLFGDVLIKGDFIQNISHSGEKKQTLPITTSAKHCFSCLLCGITQRTPLKNHQKSLCSM